MNAETVISFFRSPGIRATACPGGKIGWFPSFWRRSRPASRRRGLHLKAPRRCWTPLLCQQGGSQYRRLIGAFQRIFGATIFFGTDSQRERAAVVHQARFNFMSEARIWYSRDPNQKLLPGDCQNVIVLSDEFYQEILNHPIPTDLEAAKALSSSPAALDLFMWLSYRCFTARGPERVPLFGDFGLISQLGSADYVRPRKFREKLEGWLDLVRTMWPACPAAIDQDGARLFVDRANAVLPNGGNDARN